MQSWQCVVAEIDAHAAARPDAVAIEQAGSKPLTYHQVVELSEAVAARLHAAGVVAGDVVGLFAERTPNAIATILGILRAGAAYLPLDIANPETRLQRMLELCGARFVMADAAAAARAPRWRQATTLVIEECGQPDARIALAIAPQDLAYIIFTSGSTGEPKGVMVEHASLSAFTAAARGRFGITEADRVLQFTSLCWDTSIEEIFPCLASGATLVLRTPTMIDSFSTFLHALEQWRVSVIDVPTAMFRELVQHVERREQLAATLRLVVIGGERVPAHALARWHSVARESVVLLNTYGMTEATAIATAGELSRERDWVTETAVPIGAPLQGVALRVVDAELRDVAGTDIGELLVGGTGVARGYVGRADLTAERFWTDPIDGSRWYRTGDQVRRDAHGDLIYIGRADEQVKIRGHRVEVAEVEAALLALAEIAETHVCVVEHPHGDRALVAYVVPRRGAQLNHVRTELAKTLPEYMVPSAVVELAAIPVTPIGKIDRAALPSPWSARDGLLPQNPIEGQLCALWSEVLGLARVGIDEHFIDLGGTSLQAMQLVARIGELFSAELTVVDLFEAGDIRGLASRLSA